MEYEYAEKRILTPHAYHENPEHVLADKELSQDQKKRVLISMRNDGVLLSKATAESMGGGEKPSLKAIGIALQNLECDKGT